MDTEKWGDEGGEMKVGLKHNICSICKNKLLFPNFVLQLKILKLGLLYGEEEKIKHVFSQKFSGTSHKCVMSEFCSSWVRMKLLVTIFTSDTPYKTFIGHIILIPPAHNTIPYHASFPINPYEIQGFDITQSLRGDPFGPPIKNTLQGKIGPLLCPRAAKILPRQLQPSIFFLNGA